MKRFVVDFLASHALRALFVLLAPGLIVSGRSVRAKFLGARTLLGIAFWAVILSFLAVQCAGVVPSPLAGRYLVFAALPSFALMFATDTGLRWTRPRRSAEFVEGWSSVDYARGVTGYAEGTVAVENDFLGFAVELFTRLNPMLTRAQAATIRGTVADDLEVMAERPELERLPSALSWKILFDNLSPFDPASDREQAFVYVPPHDKGETLPLVVVCHGHGGNPLLGCLPWETLADELGFVAAFPSFGYGNWEHPDGATAVLKCRKAVCERFAADDSRAVLAGISQGGCGVTRGATVAKWAGLVYVSATMELPLLSAGSAFAELWPGKPVLVAQGMKDVNVRPHTVDAAVEAMRAAGVAVTYAQDAEADHFYFFERRDEFAEAFRAWWPQVMERHS